MQDASRPIWFKQEEVKTGEVTPQRTIQTDGFNFKNVKSCNKNFISQLRQKTKASQSLTQRTF